jgi:hypothetical protein
MILLAKAGATIPDELVSGGVAGLASVLDSQESVLMKAIGGLDWVALKSVLNEMMDRCVQIQPDPRHPETKRPLLANGDDIEEVPTLIRLRKELVALHLNFLASVNDSSSQGSEETKTSNLQTTSTSPA